VTESIVKRRVVLSKPGAALRIERLELTDDASARLVTGVLRLERGDIPGDVLDKIANDIGAVTDDACPRSVTEDTNCARNS